MKAVVRNVKARYAIRDVCPYVVYELQIQDRKLGGTAELFRPMCIAHMGLSVYARGVKSHKVCKNKEGERQ